MSGKRAAKAIVFLVVLIVLGGAGLFVYELLNEKPKPTDAQWEAIASTLAGDGSLGFNNGKNTDARFADPFGIAIDSKGNIFVADAGNNNLIRKIAADGQVSTFAGGGEGFKDGQGANASFNTPSALAIDSKDNLYVADTGNNAIRKISPTGVVETLAGDGNVGYKDGQGKSAEFNAPVGIAVDREGNVYVADSYNDRIREISIDGAVKTIAGGSTTGNSDGQGSSALFDTPCGITVGQNDDLFVADTGNSLIRKITREGVVSTFTGQSPDGSAPPIPDPLGIISTFDGFLYVTTGDRDRVFQISPDGRSRLVSGSGAGFGNGAKARFNNPTGIAVDRRGDLYVSDSNNYLIRKLSHSEDQKNVVKAETQEVLPRLTPENLQITRFPWPVAPQREWHEVAGTMGEVRGSFDGESRDHFHSGMDVQGNMGTPVLSVYDEKVVSPLASFGLEGLNEGFRVGMMTYVHLRVGRNERDEPLKDNRFTVVRDDQGKIARVRIRRGARFHVGDTLGTINRMYHVHLNFGPWGAEINPFNLPFIGFSDKVPPTIERDGIHLFDASGQRLKQMRNGRLLVAGDVSIVVDAYDQVDGNQARRRLGLYRLGYQILKTDGSPAPGFEEPKITMEFNRLPPDREAVK